MTERCLVVERYVILSLVTITTAEWYCCCWSLGTTRESGDGRWTLRGNKRKSQLPMNNHETEEGIGGRARTQTPTLRNTNMGSTLVFFIAFTSWLEDEKMRGNVNQTYVSVWSFFLFFYTFIYDQQEWDSSRQQVTSAGKLKMMKSTSQAQCGWGANPTMLIGTTGISPLLREAGCSVKDSGALQINADVEMLNLIFCMKTYGWKLGREKW